VPDQPDPRQPDDLQELKLQPQPQSVLAANASRRLKSEDMLIGQYAGALLRREMDRIPLWRGNHVSIKELAENFAKYVYLPRLRNTEVLLAAIREGVQSNVWERETFAYADSWDAERQRYLGLKAGHPIALTTPNANNVLVKPEVAAAQIAADQVPITPVVSPPEVITEMNYPEAQTKSAPVVGERGGASVMEPTMVPNTPPIPITATPVQREPQLQRFHGSVNINPRMMAGDAGKIMEEVVKHLTALYGANVRITLEIQADVPGGVPAKVVQDVTENCRTLKFEGYGFEQE
jgi:hypothetical protein